MKEIIPKFIERIVILIIGIPSLFVVGYFVFMCSQPTDYAHIKVNYKKKIGNQFELNLRKEKVLNRLSPAHTASDTSRNLSDSLFVVYFHPSNDSLTLNALVRIIKKDQNSTIIKFDSIIGYGYRAFYESQDIMKIINNFDSLDYVDQFYRNVIKKITADSAGEKQVFYDNKLILNSLKE